ncbi:hypothetical protein, conserved [Entamoeba dispar SAW760]|uniref:Metal dependent hydrolase n=1 Tax=Entamoeba dispar (strain ATCC PRA-260 / SAW760) TaxID=370354 RepID=B0EP07_ENTDS|nr:uncharacterized protein EDI_308780 [Entamoeba dispar SAW760]EDR23746.1 hypothetical protein, conserved [Entamoeba dispar SAW760]|eukprot:EDR23746.1 hypothetical protein, conserved [Entamoeba dispar SAW760]
MKSKIIGTHDGLFHCDELTSCVILLLTKEFMGSKIRRTRDSSILKECDVVVDVGKEFNVEHHLFDHHQQGFNERWEGSPTLFSSAGLIYKYYGREIIIKLCKGPHTVFEDEEEIKWFMNKWYFFYFVSIDAEDNGCPRGKEQNYIEGMDSLKNVISNLNELRGGFDIGLTICKLELVKSFYRLLINWRPTVKKYPASYFKQEIVFIDDQEADWVSLCEMASLNKITLVVVKKENNKYIGRVVKDRLQPNFSWPKEWRGMYGYELKNIIGNGVICCDRTGTEIVCEDIKTVENALRIAKKVQK